MFGRTFYHDTLRRYVILFGTLFNDVWINREDGEGNVKQSIKVPLAYGPREKFLARIEGIEEGRDPLQQPFSVVLPRMGFEITGFTYAPERKLPTRNKFKIEDIDQDGDRKVSIYNPVPYDIQFSLSIFVKNTTDGTRIIEQILPYFTPEWTSTVLLTETPEVKLDIPVVLTGTSQDDVYEGSYEDRRALIWTLDFTMKGFFFGPEYKADVIKLANTQIFDSTLYDDIDLSISNVDVATKLLAEPGLIEPNTSTVFSDINAQQATAVAVITGGYVSDIIITNIGYGYSDTPATITIDGNATATATMGTGYNIDRIVITDGGSGYTETPTITISAPDLVSTANTAAIDSESNYGIALSVLGPYPDEG